jgi:hypothetical protein
LKLPEIQYFIREVQEQVAARTAENLAAAIDHASSEAVERLLELMRDAPASVSLRATESVLDRSSIVPKRIIHQKVDGEKKVTHLHVSGRQFREWHQLMLDTTDDPSKVPNPPQIADNESLEFEIDRKTGEILSSRKL